jgi:hypothetical protein
MSDAAQGPGWWIASDGRWYPPQAAPSPYGAYGPVGVVGANRGPLGVREDILIQVLLAVVTLGLYGIYWAYKRHEEIKLHAGEGVGGVVGAVIYVVVGVVTLFLLPIEIKRMYEREGMTSPVGPATAFWVLLFVIPWYVKCQSAMNAYWAHKGVPAR